MRIERLALDTLVLGALAISLGALGFVLAPTIFDAAVRAIGPRELALSSPSDLEPAYLGIGLALASPPALAWIVLLGYRIAAGRAPGLAIAGTSTLLLVLATLAGMARMVWLWSAFLSEPTSIRPMLTPGSLALGDAGFGYALRAAIVLGLLAYALGRRRARRAAP